MAVKWEQYFRDEILVVSILIDPTIDKKGLMLAMNLWLKLGNNN